MAKPWSDASLPIITDILAGDKLLILRESDGAAGSKIIEVEDFETSLAALVDKFIYTIAGQMLATQAGSAVLLIHVPTEDIVIPSAANRSCGQALTAATAEAIFSIRKNNVQFGTMTVAAAGTVPSFSFPSDTSFIGGTDYLTVLNPASPDATLALFGFSIWGRR